jgi:predicted RNA-binding protein YlqC (UPF0109 family)
MTTSHTVASQEDPVLKLMLGIVQSLVDDEQSVRITCVAEETLTTLNVHVAPSDTGKLIGKQGRTARSLRTVLSAAGMKFHHRYALNIEEEDRRMRE